MRNPTRHPILVSLSLNPALEYHLNMSTQPRPKLCLHQLRCVFMVHHSIPIIVLIIEESPGWLGSTAHVRKDALLKVPPKTLITDSMGPITVSSRGTQDTASDIPDIFIENDDAVPVLHTQISFQSNSKVQQAGERKYIRINTHIKPVKRLVQGSTKYNPILRREDLIRRDFLCLARIADPRFSTFLNPLVTQGDRVYMRDIEPAHRAFI